MSEPQHEDRRTFENLQRPGFGCYWPVRRAERLIKGEHVSGYSSAVSARSSFPEPRPRQLEFGSVDSWGPTDCVLRRATDAGL